MVFIST